MLTIFLYGKFKEMAGKDSIEVPLLKSVKELRTYLQENYQFLKEEYFMVAVNHTIYTDDAEISEKDEIAILPPVAGGI